MAGKRILVINGANLNMLGIREPEIYGKVSYAELCDRIRGFAAEKGLEVEIRQSNHEGDLVDWIQEAYGNTDGIVINPGGYTHTSVVLPDALKAVSIPAIEVHISDINAREDFRKIDFIRSACRRTISGHGIEGYIEAIAELAGVEL